MDKYTFLNNEDVAGFVAWAQDYLVEIPVTLNISTSGTGSARGIGRGPGVVGQYQGIDKVVNAYQWMGVWNGPDGQVISCDWLSTRLSLAGLSDWLRTSITAGNNEVLLECISEILRWGGDRNSNVGATPFFEGLPDCVQYLIGSQESFNLTTADVNNVNVVEMNSMITKVHALASEDGLPIYDSRVAAAISCLIEIYRLQNAPQWDQLPNELKFKAVDRNLRRRVTGLGHNIENQYDPGVITRDTNAQARVRRASEWASSKLRLAWLMEDIINGSELFQEPTLLQNTLTSKLHAFEAALFMMGYDVSCLEGNIARVA